MFPQPQWTTFLTKSSLDPVEYPIKRRTFRLLGVSRTSVFIAFDTLFQQLMHEHSITVARTCANLRRSRQNMVPTPRHFALLYDLLFEAGVAGHSLIDLDVRSALKSVRFPMVAVA